MKVRRRYLWVVAVVAGLTGCASTSALVHPDSSPSAHAEGPSAAPGVAPPLASLVVSADGLGPIVLDKPISTTATTLGLVSFEPADCVGDIDGDNHTIRATDPDAGGWEANYHHVNEPYGGDGPFTVATADETASGTILDTRTSAGVW